MQKKKLAKENKNHPESWNPERDTLNLCISGSILFIHLENLQCNKVIQYLQLCVYKTGP